MITINSFQTQLKIQPSQSLSFRFDFKIQGENLIIQAICQDDNTQYIGKVTQNPFFTFNQIQEDLQKKQFKLLSKNQDSLKLRTLQIEIQFFSMSRLQINQLKQITKTLSKKNEEFQQLLQSQIEQVSKLKDQIGKSQNNGFKDLTKQSVENKQTQFQTFQYKNEEIQKMKTQMQKFRTQFWQLIDETKEMNQNEIHAEMQKITNQIKNVENQLFFKLFDQHKKILKNSAYIESLTQQIKKVSAQLKSLSQNSLNQGLKQKDNQKPSKQESTSENKFNFVSNKQQQHPFKWSQELKSEKITIDGNVATMIQKSKYTEFCLLNPPLSKTLNSKQSWAIKIHDKIGWIGLGVCLRSKIMDSYFSDAIIDWMEMGSGFYMIGPSGECFSHSERDFNCMKKSFKIQNGDVIFIEYDPIESKLRFCKNKVEYFEMPIITPPQNDEYHPFVSMSEQNSSVELILPESV